MNKKQNPFNVQLADIANEVGGNMSIQYYTLDFTLMKEQLQDMKDKGLKTDVMSCVLSPHQKRTRNWTNSLKPWGSEL